MADIKRIAEYKKMSAQQFGRLEYKELSALTEEELQQLPPEHQREKARRDEIEAALAAKQKKSAEQQAAHAAEVNKAAQEDSVADKMLRDAAKIEEIQDKNGNKFFMLDYGKIDISWGKDFVIVHEPPNQETAIQFNEKGEQQIFWGENREPVTSRELIEWYGSNLINTVRRTTGNDVKELLAYARKHLDEQSTEQQKVEKAEVKAGEPAPQESAEKPKGPWGKLMAEYQIQFTPEEQEKIQKLADAVVAYGKERAKRKSREAKRDVLPTDILQTIKDWGKGGVLQAHTHDMEEGMAKVGGQVKFKVPKRMTGPREALAFAQAMYVFNQHKDSLEPLANTLKGRKAKEAQQEQLVSCLKKAKEEQKAQMAQTEQQTQKTGDDRTDDRARTGETGPNGPSDKIRLLRKQTLLKDANDKIIGRLLREIRLPIIEGRNMPATEYSVEQKLVNGKWQDIVPEEFGKKATKNLRRILFTDPENKTKLRVVKARTLTLEETKKYEAEYKDKLAQAAKGAAKGVDKEKTGQNDQPGAQTPKGGKNAPVAQPTETKGVKPNAAGERAQEEVKKSWWARFKDWLKKKFGRATPEANEEDAVASGNVGAEGEGNGTQQAARADERAGAQNEAPQGQTAEGHAGVQNGTSQGQTAEGHAGVQNGAPRGQTAGGPVVSQGSEQSAPRAPVAPVVVTPSAASPTPRKPFDPYRRNPLNRTTHSGVVVGANEASMTAEKSTKSETEGKKTGENKETQQKVSNKSRRKAERKRLQAVLEANGGLKRRKSDFLKWTEEEVYSRDPEAKLRDKLLKARSQGVVDAWIYEDLVGGDNAMRVGRETITTTDVVNGIKKDEKGPKKDEKTDETWGAAERRAYHEGLGAVFASKLAKGETAARTPGLPPKASKDSKAEDR